MAKSTKAAPSGKPEKPSADFPLFPHQNGQWAKKVRGKLWPFGPWSDPDVALERWLDDKDELLAGRTPRPKSDGLTLKGLCDRFLTEKRHRIDSGEQTARTYRDYYAVAEFLCDALGKNRLTEDGPSTSFRGGLTFQGRRPKSSDDAHCGPKQSTRFARRTGLVRNRKTWRTASQSAGDRGLPGTTPAVPRPETRRTRRAPQAPHQPEERIGAIKERTLDV